MAFRIGEMVVCGELINSRRNCVHGWIGLRGFRRPVHLELTGNPSPDLVGKHIRFRLRDWTEDEAEGEAADSSAAEKAQLKRLGLSGLAWQQIGPTGMITAIRQVRIADCPPEEFYRRCKLGEPPPTVWKPCLTIEWFSQNGRVLIEMVDPEIEYVEADEEESQPEMEPAGKDFPDSSGLMDSDDDESDLAASSFDVLDEFDPPDLDDSDENDEPVDADDDDACNGCGESWTVVSDELQRALDAQSRELDRAVHGDSEESDVIREMELMDHLIEHSDGEPLGSLFDEVIRLPSPDSLDDAQAEATLKVLLAKLALYGIALDMCEHFSARDAYRLLIDKICREEHAYRELRGTQWVQHFSTWEYCKECEAALEREFQARQEKEEIQDSPEEPPPTNHTPDPDSEQEPPF